MQKVWKANLIIYITLLAILLPIYLLHTHLNQSKKSFSLNLSNKDFGDIVSIIRQEEDLILAVHYPSFGKSKIDSSIKKLVEDHITRFRNLVQEQKEKSPIYKPELNIDYEVYRSGENLISVKFIITENFPFYAHPNVLLETMTYDLKIEKQLFLSDLFKGKYLKKVSNISRKYFSTSQLYRYDAKGEIFLQGTAATEENFKNFLLDGNKIIFVFEKYQAFPGSYGIVSVEFESDKLKDFLRYENYHGNSLEVLSTNYIEYGSEPEVSISRSIDPSKAMVALTFDDGPSEATNLILDTLEEYDSVATFFVLGNRVAANKDIIKRIVRNGSEIGNHSYNHKQLTVLSSDDIESQINKTQRAVMEVLGFAPRLLRPTYGSHSERLRKQVDMPLILWSIDTEDWKTRDAKKIADHILANVRDGDIVLMHDLYMSTAEAVEIVVPQLINRGYQLVTVSELYGVGGDLLKVGNVYMDNRVKPVSGNSNKN